MVMVAKYYYLVHERTVSRGVPQGSVLSPTPFNVAVASLPRALENDFKSVKLSKYADDACICISGFQRKRLAMIAQAVIRSVQAYLSSVGLVVSAEISCFILFPGWQRQGCAPEINLRWLTNPAS